MKYFGDGISKKHKDLNRIIRKADKLEQAKELFLEIHAKLNLSEVSGTGQNEVDRLLNGLTRAEYAIMPTNKDETIAWVFWHIARIEDLTMNVLAAQREQVFDNSWKDGLKVSITDTGNALSDDEIMCLSKSIDIENLLSYRNEVAKRTREVVRNLKAEDMTRPVAPADLEKILSLGGVTEDEDSIWLLDFWGKKDVAGLLQRCPFFYASLCLHLANAPWIHRKTALQLPG